MGTSGCHTSNFIFLLLIVFKPICCWDNDDLELFDLVEEVDGNFYDLLEVSRDATPSEIKKAYRKKTLLLHPDKNEAEDAEAQFRKLVAVYEVLKDETKREKYNLVLENGLPDWRQPVFYYRKARKLGLWESALILGLVITIGQYFVLWAAYLEKRLSLIGDSPCFTIERLVSLDSGRQPMFYYRKARKLGLWESALILGLVITIGQYFVLWAAYLEKRLSLIGDSPCFTIERLVSLDSGRQPVFYYRKARKLVLWESALILGLVITIGQYFVLWAAYLEKRLSLVSV